MISGSAMLAGVIGCPVAHSLSPKLHNRWIAELGLDAAYLPLAVTPEDLPEVLRALPKMGFRGANLTIPHKEIALNLVHEVDAEAASIGAVNTVIVQADGTLLGKNTDAHGFLANLQSHVTDLAPYLPRVMVLGAGGAARAVVHALVKAGAGEIMLANRTLSKAEQLTESLGGGVTRAVAWENTARLLSDVTLLVNTTSLGLEGHEPLRLPLELLPPSALVTDIVYRPRLTELLQAAALRGHPVVDGIGMLIHQAVPGFEAWFGIKPKVTADLADWLLAP